MSRRASLLMLLMAAMAALAAGLYFGLRDRPAAGDTGQPAFALLGLALPDMAGKETPVGQWRGKLIVVNFWATWCAPCREEMPEFIRLQTQYGAKGLQFVGIAVDDVDKVRQFAAEIGLNYPALIGGYGAMELSKTLGNRLMALPFTVIIGRDGNVVHTQLGPIKSDQIQKMVAKLL